jgi:hypothetical protein
MADMILMLNVSGYRRGHTKVISSDMYFALFMKLFRPIFLVHQSKNGAGYLAWSRGGTEIADTPQALKVFLQCHISKIDLLGNSKN